MPANAIRPVRFPEDQDQIACLLRFILEREGCKVELVNDGREAQNWIINGGPPGLMLQVLMLTAKSQGKEIDRAIAAGVTDCMVKPLKPDELRARIRSLVKELP